MFRWVILFIFIAGVADASDASVLLEYTYGTHHARSRLTLFSDGTVDVLETTCCPLMDRDGPSIHLSSDDLKILRVAVDLSIDGPWESYQLSRVHDQPTGDFHAWWRGRSVVIRRIQNLSAGPRDFQNRSQAALILEQWVRGRVEQKMPALR